MYVLINILYRKYFKMRNEVLNDDVIVLDKFTVVQVKTQLQNDGYNCGVFCLKVCSYRICITTIYVNYNFMHNYIDG